MRANRHRYPDFLDEVEEVDRDFDRKGQVDVRLRFTNGSQHYVGIKSTVGAIEDCEQGGVPQLLILASERDETVFQNGIRLITQIHESQAAARRRASTLPSYLIAKIALQKAAQRQAQA